jgi:hypothetical protein
LRKPWSTSTPIDPAPGHCPSIHEACIDRRDLIVVLAVVTVWGFNFVPIRWALDGVCRRCSSDCLTGA